ncbi:MBL fold metallo-hydrolase [Thiomicrospira sp. XS5]|uniref:MBL fold metallo-hydrolase n=1 Tax=Thiomicrospira sp. XS5 TaxID=1775636 RepID=UPI000749F969|nr:MBL fold metallo-hydrolase [Thiomicrospira sp. XS5]KUJ75665.1 MBL fold metallo-hydrolase [Thiomicrospira sp. XS5]
MNVISKLGTVLLLSSVHLYSPQVLAESMEDPYTAGFEAWAKEMGNGNVAASAANTYVNEVKSTMKKAGYIGDELPLPKAVKVTDGVYTIVGSQIWHNPSNFGLNNNISFVIFKDGVFVFNAGANPAIAYSVHQQIKRLTNKPVKWVAVENNQGHAYLGASYWWDVGVKHLYSSDLANMQFDQSFDAIKSEWALRVGNSITNMARNVSDKFTTFNNKLSVDVGGGEKFILMDFGPGHTPASTSVYIPSRKVLMTGDLGFNERMPVMFAYTNSMDWVASFENMMSQIPSDVYVIPGHGTPTDMATVKKQTYDYFKYVQKEVQKVVDNGGNQEDAENIDQSMYKDRPVFDQAAKNNARRIYNEITGGDF